MLEEPLQGTNLPTIGNKPILQQISTFPELVIQHLDTFSELILILLEKYYSPVIKRHQKEFKDLESVKTVSKLYQGMDHDEAIDLLKKSLLKTELSFLKDQKYVTQIEYNLNYLSGMQSLFDELFTINSDIDTTKFVLTWINKVFPTIAIFLENEPSLNFAINPPIQNLEIRSKYDTTIPGGFSNQLQNPTNKAEVKKLSELIDIIELLAVSITESSQEYIEMLMRATRKFPNQVQPDGAVRINYTELQECYPEGMDIYTQSFNDTFIDPQSEEKIRISQPRSYFPTLNYSELVGLFFKSLEILEQTLWVQEQWSIEESRFRGDQLAKNVPSVKINKLLQAKKATFFTKLRKEWGDRQAIEKWSFNYPTLPKPADLREISSNNTQPIDGSDDEESRVDIEEIESDTNEPAVYVEPITINQEATNQYMLGVTETLLKSTLQQIPQSDQIFIKKLISYILHCILELKIESSKLCCQIGYILRYHKVEGLASKTFQVGNEMVFGGKIYYDVIKINLAGANRLILHNIDDKIGVEFMTAAEYHDTRKI